MEALLQTSSTPNQALQPTLRAGHVGCYRTRRAHPSAWLSLGSLGVSMICFLTIASLFINASSFADIAREPWPNSLQDFPEPGMHLVSGFQITVKEAADQSAGGSGGAIYDIVVRQTRTGIKRTINDQSVGVRVLALYHGWPQLEIWGRGGGGSWSRTLYRCIEGTFEYVRTDEFSENEFAAKDKSRITAMPKVETTLYFVETRLPEHP